MNKFNKEAQEKLIKEAEDLSVILRSMNQGIYHLRERLLLLITILFLTAFIAFHFSSSFQSIELQNNYHLVGVFILVMFGLLSLVKFQKVKLNQKLGLLIVLICIVFYVAGVVKVHTMPFLLLPTLILLVSIMLNPLWSLLINGGLIGLEIGMFLIHPIETHFAFRMTFNSIAVFLIIQIVMRERILMGSKTAAVLDKLRELSARLGVNISEITRQRNEALAKDFQTGLLTGYSFKNELAQYLLTNPPKPLVLCSIRILKLDEFLIINNSKFNDFFLKNLIEKLGQFLEPELIARTSKGEFVGVLKPFINSDDLEKSVQKVFEDFQNSFDIKSESLLSMQRMGIAVWPDDGKNAEELISCSNMALLKAIESETLLPVFYHQQMSDDLQKAIQLANEIENAIKENQFELFFQPIVYRNPHTFSKVEALLRWNHPQYGLLGPNIFIPLATNNGSIIKLTNWVLEQSVQKLQILQSSNSNEFRVSINFPPECLNHCVENPEYIDYLKSFGTSIRGIVLEITEGALLYVTPEVLDVIYDLKNIGFQLALDDFGIGYSSLSQLNNLPFDYLKIDKSLIDNIESSSKSLLICKFITQLAHEFDCKVISEGVETQQQLSLLDGVGMDFVQGYVYAKPMQFDQLKNFMIE